MELLLEDPVLVAEVVDGLGLSADPAGERCEEELDRKGSGLHTRTVPRARGAASPLPDARSSSQTGRVRLPRKAKFSPLPFSTHSRIYR